MLIQRGGLKNILGGYLKMQLLRKQENDILKNHYIVIKPENIMKTENWKENGRNLFAIEQKRSSGSGSCAPLAS